MPYDVRGPWQRSYVRKVQARPCTDAIVEVHSHYARSHAVEPVPFARVFLADLGCSAAEHFPWDRMELVKVHEILR